MVPQCTVYACFILACLISITPAYQQKYFKGENFPFYGIDIMLLRNQSMEKLQLDSRILSALGLFLALSASKKKNKKKNKQLAEKKTLHTVTRDCLQAYRSITSLTFLLSAVSQHCYHLWTGTHPGMP